MLIQYVYNSGSGHPRVEIKIFSAVSGGTEDFLHRKHVFYHPATTPPYVQEGT